MEQGLVGVAWPLRTHCGAFPGTWVLGEGYRADGLQDFSKSEGELDPSAATDLKGNLTSPLIPIDKLSRLYSAYLPKYLSNLAHCSPLHTNSNMVQCLMLLTVPKSCSALVMLESGWPVSLGISTRSLEFSES